NDLVSPGAFFAIPSTGPSSLCRRRSLGVEPSSQASILQRPFRLVHFRGRKRLALPLGAVGRRPAHGRILIGGRPHAWYRVAPWRCSTPKACCRDIGLGSFPSFSPLREVEGRCSRASERAQSWENAAHSHWACA